MRDTNRPPLSPAAQAVMDAFNRGWEPSLTAALRAAADQCAEGATHWELYALAAELEGHHD